MKSIRAGNLWILGVAGFFFALCSSAFADPYARYKGSDVIHCSGEEPYQVDFSKMTGQELLDGGVMLRLTLQWYGSKLQITRADSFGGSFGGATIEITTGAGASSHFSERVETNPVLFDASCHDDAGLIPNAHFKLFDPAEGQAANQPPPPEAKAISAKLSAAQKSKAQASFKQAFELFQAGEFEAAIVGFKEGLAIDPADGRANYYLGECYAKNEQDDLARIRYRRAVDLAPGSKEAFLAQARLKKQ